MTPHEQDLIKKLDQEVKNLSILMQGTEVGDSLTLKEVRHLLYELNKRIKIQDSAEAEMRAAIEKARNMVHLSDNDKFESMSGLAVPVDMKEHHKNLQRIAEEYIEEMYHDIQKRKVKINTAPTHPPFDPFNTQTTQPPY